MGSNRIQLNISLVKYQDYKDFLLDLYLEHKSREKTYTYMRLATDLGFPPTGVIHQIVKGRRTLTAKAGKKIAVAVGLQGDKFQYFMEIIEYTNSNSPEQRLLHFKKLLELKSRIDPSRITFDQLEYVSEWFHPVIRELIALPNISQDLETISHSLCPKISINQASASLALLQRLNLIKLDLESGRFVATQGSIVGVPDDQNLILARYHQTMIEMGLNSITAIKPENRDISSNTLRISYRKMNELKRKVYEFQMKLLHEEESVEDTDEIYQINIQVFPLTNIGKSHKG